MDARTRLTDMDAVARLAARDVTLFADPAIAADRLGWVGLPAAALEDAEALEGLGTSLGRSGIRDLVLLGMGGSSLAPLVLGRVIGSAEGCPVLHVLDTTSPAQVADLLARLRPATTLVLVSSKSGTTIEPLSLAAVFAEWMEPVDDGETGLHFAAVTDPVSSLEEYAEENGFSAVFRAPADIGGRYAALTPFATVPAGMIGIDVARLARAGVEAEAACVVDDEENPGAALAAWLADAYEGGRDKLTVVASEALAPFGLWVEQLVAESTGKQGRGLLPVLEPGGDPEAHDSDRMTFVLRTEHDESLASLPRRLPDGEPVFEVVMSDVYALGGEFVRWEWAIALFSALEGIECFDQPNVAEAKAATEAILSGERSAPEPQLHQGGIAVTARLPHIEKPDGVSLASTLTDLLRGAGPGDYLAVLAYLPEDETLLGPLRDACAVVAESRRMAVTLELGPRYLHSTGQYHKGGPATGRFIVVTSRATQDVRIPGKPFTLAALQRAQAEGDLVTLMDHGRPVVRVDLPLCEPSGTSLLAVNLERAARG
jgi:glucose-6-phosphate isomerase